MPSSTPSPLRSLAAVLALAIAMPLSACIDLTPEDREGPLRGTDIGGDFTLVGSDGQPVSWDDFAGQWRIVYFGYTFCPDVCPIDSQAIGQGLAQFEKDHPEAAGKITPIFITVDPARDTPEVVGQFASAFHPRMVGLTGSEEAIAEAAKKFVVYYSVDPQETGGDNYLVGHSNQAMLFDPEGNPISLLPTDTGAPAVAGELAKWVK